MTDLVLMREHPDRDVTHDGSTGRRGVLRGPFGLLCTVERLDGYKMLPPGVYHCEMGFWTRRKWGRTFRRKAIRVLGPYSADRIYIHSANWPDQLTGCIAPGMCELVDGVSQSRKAMGLIIEALGGWVEGRRVTLSVETHPDG